MNNGSALLGPSDPPCFRVAQEAGASPFVLTCDHAGSALPERLGSLGLSAHELSRHIALDLGVAELGQKLARRLDAFLILQTYSRLVIDVNRPPESPDSIVTRSEATDIPGNFGLGPREKKAREEAVFAPYHQRLRSELDRRAALGRPSVLITLHSFTPVFMGQARPWHVGVLYGRQAELGRALLTWLRRDAALVVGDNQPYAVQDASDYTLLTHGEQRGIPHVELEIRQDLLADEPGQEQWAERLAAALTGTVSALFPSLFV